MKKQILSFGNVRNAIVKLTLAAVITAGTFGAANAQPFNNPSAQVQYIGSSDDQLIFEVQYANATGEAFSVEIKDAQGYQFYFDKSKDKTFRKRFAISRSELGDNAITFVVVSKNGAQQQSFDVNSSCRVVEQVSVVKL